MKGFSNMFGGDRNHSMNRIDDKTQREFVKELMSARGSDVKYDMMTYYNSAFYFMSSDDVTWSTKPSASNQSEYLVVMVHGKTMVTDDVMRVLKERANNGSLQMVIHTNEIEYTESGWFESNVHNYFFLFSLQHSNNKVRFAFVDFSYKYKLSDLSEDKIMDITFFNSYYDDVNDVVNTTYNIGKGKYIDVDYSTVLRKCSLNPFFYLHLIEKSDSADNICIELGDILKFVPETSPTSHYGFLNVDDFKTDYLSIINAKKNQTASSDLSEKNVLGSAEGLFLILLDDSRMSFLWNNAGMGYVFNVKNGQKVMRFMFDENIVDYEYFIERIVGAINEPYTNPLAIFRDTLRGYTDITLDECLRLNICIPKDINRQREYVKKQKTRCIEIKQEELNAEKKRLGIRDSVREFKHLTSGSIKYESDTIKKILRMLDKGETDIKEHVLELKWNVDYLSRLIELLGINISERNNMLEDIDLTLLVTNYCKYRQSIYGFSLCSEVIGNIPIFQGDKVLILAAIDAAVENARRHGFNKGGRKDINKVLVCVQQVLRRNNDCIKLSVCNNGAPFPNSLTFDEFKAYGVARGANANTGIGGYHITEIIEKVHGGEVEITSDREWATIVNLYLPIKKQSNE